MTKITPKLEAAVSTMIAGGVSTKKVSKLYGLSPDTVLKIVRKPENQEFIAAAREHMRAYALGNLLKAQGGAWRMLRDAIENRDPRAFDQITRGLNALERIGSSVGGDSQKIEGEYTVRTETEAAEAKELIEALRKAIAS